MRHNCHGGSRHGLVGLAVHLAISAEDSVLAASVDLAAEVLTVLVAALVSETDCAADFVLQTVSVMTDVLLRKLVLVHSGVGHAVANGDDVFLAIQDLASLDICPSLLDLRCIVKTVSITNDTNSAHASAISGRPKGVSMANAHALEDSDATAPFNSTAFLGPATMFYAQAFRVTILHVGTARMLALLAFVSSTALVNNLGLVPMLGRMCAAEALARHQLVAVLNRTSCSPSVGAAIPLTHRRLHAPISRTHLSLSLPLSGIILDAIVQNLRRLG